MLRGNVIVKERRLAAIIDFGSVHGGDPARDLVAGWTLLTSERLGDPACGGDSYYRDTNRNMVEGALHTIAEILADIEAGD